MPVLVVFWVWGWDLRRARPRDPLPPSQMKIKTETENGFGPDSGPALATNQSSAGQAVKKNKNGNGFGPGSGPAGPAQGPDWPSRPSQKEISLYNCQNRSRFFYCLFAGTAGSALADVLALPQLKGKTVYVFLF